MPAPSVKTSKPERFGRDRLRYFHAEIGKADDAIKALEATVDRLGAIIAEADQAQRLLQTAIAADGGMALAKYGSGQAVPASESDIAEMITLERKSREAAEAAKLAIPTAQAALANAKAQIITLNEQRNAELNRLLADIADETARAYKDAFSKACRLHDELVGYAAVAQSNVGDVRLTNTFPSMPRFATPSLGDSNADPFLRHNPSDLTIAESRRRWEELKSRLEADVNANIDDLI